VKRGAGCCKSNDRGCDLNLPVGRDEKETTNVAVCGTSVESENRPRDRAYNARLYARLLLYKSTCV